MLLLAATTFGPLPSRMLRGAVALRQTEHRLASSISAGSDSQAVPDVLPELIVFDLDACLWDKEMFEMSAVPDGPKDSVRGDLNGRGDGVTGVLSGCDKISLHTGALAALQAHADGDFAGVRVALASSANTRFAESVGRAALTVLEVLPGRCRDPDSDLNDDDDEPCRIRVPDAWLEPPPLLLLVLPFLCSLIEPALLTCLIGLDGVPCPPLYGSGCHAGKLDEDLPAWAHVLDADDPLPLLPLAFCRCVEPAAPPPPRLPAFLPPPGRFNPNPTTSPDRGEALAIPAPAVPATLSLPPASPLCGPPLASLPTSSNRAHNDKWSEGKLNPGSLAGSMTFSSTPGKMCVHSSSSAECQM